jgi:S1-C subfamily serine protease
MTEGRRLPGCGLGQCLAILFFACCAVLLGSEARAEEKGAAVGFSNLVFRFDGQEVIAIATEEVRIHILESLRSMGFNAVGAENLALGKDHSSEAQFVLGGTALEFACKDARDGTHCRIGIEWQLLDVRTDSVVYRALTRHVVYSVAGMTPALGRELIVGALKSLAKRQKLHATLRSTPLSEKEAVYPAARFRRCDREAMALPDEAEKALAATVLVRSGDRVGSGVLFSADGLILSAAHIAEAGTSTVQLHDGTKLRARTTRISRKYDVALLVLEDGDKSTWPCLDIDVTPKVTGREIVALGAPAGEDFAFSATRGIISGVRAIKGLPFLQTDASINPGNSGGPLVGKDGRIVGLASWKIAHHAIEGMAFAVPIEAALDALHLRAEDATDLATLSKVSARPAPAAALLVDVTDAMPSLDPVGDRERERARHEADQQRRLAEITPTYIPIMRWAGLGLAIAGGLTAIVSYAEHDPSDSTRDDFEGRRLVNYIGWAMAGVGASAFTLSFIIAPSLSEVERKPARRETRLSVSPGAVNLAVTF